MSGIAAPRTRANASALLIGASIVVAALIIGTALLIVRTSPARSSGAAAPTCAELAESEVFHGSITATPGGVAPAEVPAPAGRAVTRCNARFDGGDSTLTVIAFAGASAGSYDSELTAAGWARVPAPDGVSYSDLSARYDLLVFPDLGDLVVAYLPFS